MSLSYVRLLTGFLVDNGPLLPLWHELPHVFPLVETRGIEPLTPALQTSGGALPGTE